MVTFYISPQGKDSWSGKLPEPDAVKGDGPFATLTGARDAIRVLKAAGEVFPSGVTLLLRGGDYPLEKGFRLESIDSGTETAPVVYRAYPGETPRLLGGRQLLHFSPLDDPEVLNRLDEEVRPHILQADLRAHGIADFGKLHSRGYGRPRSAAHLEMFFGKRYNAAPMILARYPNLGAPVDLGDGTEEFIDHSKEPEGSEEDMRGWTVIACGAGERKHLGHREPWYVTPLDKGFHYVGDRPRRWKSMKNVWVHGFWAMDWANSYEEIDYIDLDRRFIQLKPDYGHIGYQAKQRIFFINILEELDAPGEYFVDAEKGMLYFYPPESLEGKEILASMLEETMLVLENASHIRIEGLVFEATRASGIEIKDGEGVLIAGCTLRNIGSQAITIQEGKNHGVQSCDISAVGDGGIEIRGGDRKTLTRCNHFAKNNHIWNFSRWSFTYSPALGMYGVGILAAHNLIHDAPHIAVMYVGNYIQIEYNRIHHVCMKSGDTGALYTGRSFTARGNTVRYNYIHDMGGFGGVGSNGMYYDDCVSGQKLVGNIFRNSPRACFIGGGRDILVENNFFIDCTPSIQVDGRGIDPNPQHWQPMVYKTLKPDLEDYGYLEPPYSEAFPELKEYATLYESTEGIPPGNISIQKNICVGGTWTNIHWCAEEKHLDIGENWVGGDPGFVSLELGDYRLRQDAPARGMGIADLPVDKIGLVVDEFRKTV